MVREVVREPTWLKKLIIHRQLNKITASIVMSAMKRSGSVPDLRKVSSSTIVTFASSSAGTNSAAVEVKGSAADSANKSSRKRKSYNRALTELPSPPPEERKYRVRFQGNNSKKWDGKDIVVDGEWLESLYTRIHHRATVEGEY